jgi:hypothetical protein
LRRGRRGALLALAAFAPAAAWVQVAPTRLVIPGETGWHYSAALYAYLPTVGGTSSYPVDSGGTPITPSADKILDKLKMFGMGTFGAHNGTWGVFTDVVYLNFGGEKSGSRDFSIGNIGLPADASASFGWDLKGWVVTLAGEYRVAADPSWTVDVLAGGRWFDRREKLSWSISGSIGPLDPASRSGSLELSQSTFDAIVGVKGRYGFGANREWSVPFYLDIGTGQSKSTYQAAAGIAYGFKGGEVTLMYRYLGYRLQDDRGFQDVHFNGPLVGVAFRW